LTEFHAAFRFLKRFELEMFVRSWTALIESGAGIIFLLSSETRIAGALGGIAYPDLYSGDLIATEFFWFVREGSRGGGLKLYRAFEQWARDRQCSQIRMVHLLDSMPEKLSRVYKHLGFVPAETHYVKALTPETMK
jgi:GNAT superfamily N-acetyltransferase